MFSLFTIFFKQPGLTLHFVDILLKVAPSNPEPLPRLTAVPPRGCQDHNGYIIPLSVSDGEAKGKWSHEEGGYSLTARRKGKAPVSSRNDITYMSAF